jgi:probable O-glycosylation ligase (exosortase A-associated)
MLWTWLSIMNPHRFSWGIAYDAPLAAIAAGSTLLGLLFTKDRQSPFQGTPTTLLFLFSIWITITWQMGFDVSGDHAQWDKVMKIYLMTFVALILLTDKHKIIVFAWVTSLSMALLSAKGGLFTILTGGNYLVWGPPGSFIADNNHFALAVIMTIPLLYFLQLQLEKKSKCCSGVG